MNNTIRPRYSCQDFYTKNNPVSPGFYADPVQFVKSKPLMAIGVLNQMIVWDRKFRGKVFIKQATLAGRLGISREWANKLLRVWEEAGLIMRDYYHMRTNFYRISPILFQESIRSTLVSLLPALRVIALSLLLSHARADALIDDAFTHTIKLVIKNLKTNYYYSHTIAKERLAMTFVRQELNGKPVSAVAMRLTDQIGLTALGQIKLSAYPDEAIEYAYRELKSSRNHIYDEFKYLCKMASNYCSQAGITPDWGYISRTIMLYKINPSSAHIDPSLIKKEDPLPDVFGDRQASNSVSPTPVRRYPLMQEKRVSREERIAFLQSEVSSWKKNIEWALTTDFPCHPEFMTLATVRLNESIKELEGLVGKSIYDIENQSEQTIDMGDI